MTVGIIAGTFDLVHPGHIVLLRECKKKCDVLIVALHVDPSIERSYKNKPVMTVFERWTVLNAVEDVSTIIPYETERDLVNMYASIRPDFVFVGSDHAEEDVTGSHLAEVVFVDRLHGWSSSELRSRLKR
jgi:glycerol-3-phosphate cytidylyltransferase